MESIYYKCKRECIQADRQSSEVERRKVDLLIALENSRSFATTHSVIADLKNIDQWTPDELETLFEIAVNNSQVFYILHDADVKTFYRNLIKSAKVPSPNAQKVIEAMETKEQ